MKKALVVLAVSFFAFSGNAFGQKYGHINSTDVVHSMPEYKQMTMSVEKRQKDAQTKVQAMYVSYQQKVKELNTYANSMMEAVLEERKREIDSLQQSISVYSQTEESQIQEFQSKLMKPIYDKYHKTVSAVAKENGYTYIFDIATGTVAYYPEASGDVTDLVKKKLGIN